MSNFLRLDEAIEDNIQLFLAGGVEFSMMTYIIYKM